MTPTERQLERALMDYLAFTGWVVLKTDTGEAARATKGKSKRTSLPIGTPDLIALKGGQGIAIEVKTKRGFVSLHQRLEHRRYAACGVPVRVIRSLEELRAWLGEVAG